MCPRGCLYLINAKSHWSATSRNCFSVRSYYLHELAFSIFMCFPRNLWTSLNWCSIYTFPHLLEAIFFGSSSSHSHVVSAIKFDSWSSLLIVYLHSLSDKMWIKEVLLYEYCQKCDVFQHPHVYVTRVSFICLLFREKGGRNQRAICWRSWCVLQQC